MRDRAREIADQVLFPAALTVDQSERVPATHLDVLAADGFYGVAIAPGVGFPEFGEIVSTLAGGCLTTAFVWIQHHSPVRAIATSASAEQRDRWLPLLVTGRRRAGIGIAGVRNRREPLRIRRSGDQFVLDGVLPWVTGWNMIDTIHLAAVDESDVVHFLLMDAEPADTITITTPQLVAVQASGTVNLRFSGHPVPADRLVRTVPYREWSAEDSHGSALNGFLALGVVDRCWRLLQDGPAAAYAGNLATAAARIHSDLLAADPDQQNVARAAASDLAWRAAGAVCAGGGARSVLRDQHGQRLAREAVFLLVFGSRPAMRDALLGRLAPLG